MSTNYVQAGDRLTLAAPYAVAAGAGAKISLIFGVALDAAANGATVVLATTGVWTLLAEGSGSGQDLAVGAAVYWDDANKRCTATSSGNTKIGVAVAAKLTAATAVTVRLNGTF